MEEDKLYQSVLSLLKESGVEFSCIIPPSAMLIPSDKERKVFFLSVGLFFASHTVRLTVADTCIRAIKVLIESDLLVGVEGGLQIGVFIELNEEERHPRRAPFRKVARISIQKEAYESVLNLTENDIYPEKSRNELTIVGKWFSESL